MIEFFSQNASSHKFDRVLDTPLLWLRRFLFQKQLPELTWKYLRWSPFYSKVAGCLQPYEKRTPLLVFFCFFFFLFFFGGFFGKIFQTCIFVGHQWSTAYLVWYAVGRFCTITRGVFRTQSNIYDGVFFAKIVIFAKNFHCRYSTGF